LKDSGSGLSGEAESETLFSETLLAKTPQRFQNLPPQKGSRISLLTVHEKKNKIKLIIKIN